MKKSYRKTHGTVVSVRTGKWGARCALRIVRDCTGCFPRLRNPLLYSGSSEGKPPWWLSLLLLHDSYCSKVKHLLFRWCCRCARLMCARCCSPPPAAPRNNNRPQEVNCRRSRSLILYSAYVTRLWSCDLMRVTSYRIQVIEITRRLMWAESNLFYQLKKNKTKLVIFWKGLFVRSDLVFIRTPFMGIFFIELQSVCI